MTPLAPPELTCGVFLSSLDEEHANDAHAANGKQHRTIPTERMGITSSLCRWTLHLLRFTRSKSGTPQSDPTFRTYPVKPRFDPDLPSYLSRAAARMRSLDSINVVDRVKNRAREPCVGGAPPVIIVACSSCARACFAREAALADGDHDGCRHGASTSTRARERGARVASPSRCQLLERWLRFQRWSFGDR